MKFIIVAAVALLAVASAHPVEENPSQIVSSTSKHEPDGGFAYSFESKDGTKRNEKVVVVSGFYTYINPEGKEEYITYIADEKGFHPKGSSIPVVPAA